MTHPHDDHQPEEPTGPRDAEPGQPGSRGQGKQPGQPGPRLDEDAAWAEIVANYGERPSMFADPPSNPTTPTTPTTPPAAPPTRRSPFDRTYLDSQPLVTPHGELDEPTDPRDELDRELRDLDGLRDPEGGGDGPDGPGAPAGPGRGGLAERDPWLDEGHFVPPPPPPLPVVEPRRRLAWAGLFGAPLLMLVGVVLGWSLPDWLGAILVGSFVGGFVYLVATMTRRRGDWPGDDGAVV